MYKIALLFILFVSTFAVTENGIYKFTHEGYRVSITKIDGIPLVFRGPIEHNCEIHPAEPMYDIECCAKFDIHYNDFDFDLGVCADLDFDSKQMTAEFKLIVQGMEVFSKDIDIKKFINGDDHKFCYEQKVSFFDIKICLELEDIKLTDDELYIAPDIGIYMKDIQIYMIHLGEYHIPLQF